MNTGSAPRPASRLSRLRRLAPVLCIPPLIGLVLTGFITWVNVGFADDFVSRWLRGFVSALPVMALGFAIMGVLGSLLQRHFGHLPDVLKKVMLALSMACTMEFLLATVVTLSNVGWNDGYASAWLAAFLKSLPVGLGIGLLMGFVIKPRIDRLMARV
ncbi:uncharacterized protein DUF2798 [Sphaerotilus hippei]|uniref:Uncharacterized protein DUF2798 n=1 Tax=Sphaerotilus hippei TaxID=744406 RepID=A0A318H2E6_9BURK|nr:DUF2798 domain-containing protein [Sphaerotilus hippei]PXW97417.1 uncharacterized protein DUF2798 [Sphaerotilus hippei]